MPLRGGLLTQGRDSRREAALFHQDSMDRLRQQREQVQAQEQAQADREAGLQGLIGSDPLLESAFAGGAASSRAGAGILQSRASADPAARELGGQALGNIFARRQADLDSIAQSEADIRQAVDTQGQQIRKTLAPTVALLEAGADVKNLLAEGTATSSQAAVTRLARALSDDAVREGEQARIQASAGAVDFMLSQFNALGGEGMTPAAVEQFEATVDALLAERAFNAIGRIEGFDTEAQARNIPADRRRAMFQTSGLNMRTLQAAVLRGMSTEELRARLAAAAQ